MTPSVSPGPDQPPPPESPRPRAPLRTLARGRTTMHERAAALRRTAWPIAQTAGAAAAAWAVAQYGLGSSDPAFASIAAIICLGVAGGLRGRRPFELAGGVIVGITIADLLARSIGTGPLQVAVLVVLAMTAAVLIGGGPALISEAAISAIIISTLLPPGGEFTPDRFLEALVGGGIALVVNFLLFPPNPMLTVGRAAQQVFAELGTTLEHTADALAARDVDLAERALFAARENDRYVQAFDEAVDEGRETARFAPPRRRSLERVERYARTAMQIDLAVRSTRVLARAVLRFVRSGHEVPEALPDVVRDLARAVWALAAQVDEPDRVEDTRRFARRASARAVELLEEHKDLATSWVVGAVQNTAADLVRASGLDIGSGGSLPNLPTEELLATREGGDGTGG